MKYLIFFLCIEISTQTWIPVHYDTSMIWNGCEAFIAQDQGNCNSCAAMALASTMSIRVCIRDGRNVRFSAQRIWDCYGGSCDEGVIMENFMYAIMYSEIKDSVLRLSPLARDGVMHPSNTSTCVKNAVSRKETVDIISYHKEWWAALGERPNDKSKSVQGIQLEILQNGPIMATLRLSRSEMDQFVQWENKTENALFSTHLTVAQQAEIREYLHAVTVIGWRKDNETGNFYWKILNSFGQGWGNNGIGNIPFGFGTLEHEWYAVYSSPLACNASEELCLIPSTQSAIGVVEDQIFIPSYKKSNVENKQMPIHDGEILLITAICMLILSAIIFSLHRTTHQMQIA